MPPILNGLFCLMRKMGTGPVSHHLFTFLECGITIYHQPGEPATNPFLALIFAVLRDSGDSSSSPNNHLREAARSPSPCCASPISHYQPLVLTCCRSFYYLFVVNFLRSDFPFFTLAFEIGQVPVCILAIAKRFRSSLFGESRVAK